MLPAPDLGTALLERERELKELTFLLDRAATGRGGAARLLGPAGAGKSALLRVVGQEAAAKGMQVLVASAGQLETRSPYGVVRRIFDRALMSLTPLQRSTMEAGPARLAVSHVLGSATEPVEQGDLLGSLYWLLDELAAEQPVLVVVDDVQWADEESLLFLGSLRERLRDLAVVVVIAVRETVPAERSPALASLVADREATVLRLYSLSPTGVAALLSRSWEAPVAGDVAAAASDVTGGNPFLVVALARLLESLKVTDRTAERLRETVPGSVIDSVVERLAALSDDDRALARAVAVLDLAPTHLAAQLAALSPLAASAAADRLRAAGLLDEGSELTYRHALLRSAAYASIGANRRESLHRAAARLLEGDTHAAAAQLMASPGTADRWAVGLLRRAAAEALEEGAPQSAVALLRRACSEPPASAELPDLLLELGLVEMRTGDASCVETLQRSVQSSAHPVSRARAALALAAAYNYAGLHELAADVLEPAYVGVAGVDHETELEVEAALAAAGLLVPSRIADARRRLAARTDLPGRSRGERLFLIQQMSDAVGTNQPAETIRELAGRAIADSDSPESTDWVWVRLFLAAIGDFDEVRRHVDEGFRKAAARGSVIGFVTASFVGGMVEFWAGSLLEAEAHFQAMVEHAGPLGGGPLVQMLGAANLAQTLAGQGRAGEALDLLAGFPDEMPPDAPVNGVAALCFARAMALQVSGDHAGALRAAEQIAGRARDLDVDSPTWASWRPLAVAPLRSLGRLDEARRMAAEQVDLCERSRVPHLLGEALRIQGELSPDPQEAVELLTRAVAILATTGSRTQYAQALISLGSTHRRQGRKTESRELLGQGTAIAAACGAEPLVRWASAEMEAAGVRVRRSAAVGAGLLTPSERRVAELASAGLGNRDIAARLFVSTKTVETHLSRTYRKLGIAGRDELGDALAARTRSAEGEIGH